MKVRDMCATAAGDIAMRMGNFDSPSNEIQLCDRKGKTRTTYTGLCRCEWTNKHISEVIPGQYLAEFCWMCNDIKVVDMVTHKVHKAYSGGSFFKEHVELWAMCSGPGEGSLLVWDNKSGAVIQLQWNEGKKQLKEVKFVQVSGYTIYHMCYMPIADLLILRHAYGVVEAVKLQGGAGESPVWQLMGEVLGKEIDPNGVSCDSEGRVYVADMVNSRVP